MSRVWRQDSQPLKEWISSISDRNCNYKPFSYESLSFIAMFEHSVQLELKISTFFSLCCIEIPHITLRALTESTSWGLWHHYISLYAHARCLDREVETFPLDISSETLRVVDYVTDRWQEMSLWSKITADAIYYFNSWESTFRSLNTANQALYVHDGVKNTPNWSPDLCIVTRTESFRS